MDTKTRPWAVRIFEAPASPESEVLSTAARDLKQAKRFASGLRDLAKELARRPIAYIYDPRGRAVLGSSYGCWRMQWMDLDWTVEPRILAEEEVPNA